MADVESNEYTYLEPLPAALAENPRLAGDEGEPRLIAAATDLRADGSYGHEWLIVTTQRLQIFDQLSQDALPAIEAPLTDLTQVELERLIGTATITASIRGEHRDLVRMTHSSQQLFQRLSQYLGELAKFARKNAGIDPCPEDGPPPATPRMPIDLERRTRCPQCGLMLRSGSEICPACLDKGQALMRILAYMRPYWWQMALVWLLLVVSTLLNLVPPYLTRPLVDRVLVPAMTVTDADDSRAPYTMDGRPPQSTNQRRAVEGGPPSLTPGERLRMLGLLVVGLLLAQLGAMLIGVWRGRKMARIGTQVAHDLRQEVFEHVQRHSLRFFDQHKTGDLMSRIGHDTGSLESVLIDGVQFFVVNVLTLIGIGLVLLFMNWQLTLLVLLPVPIVLIISRLISRTLRRLFHGAWSRRGKLGATLNESLSGMRVVKAFAREGEENTRFEGHSRGLQQAMMRAEQAWSTYFPTLTFLTSSGALIVWYVGGRKIIGGDELTLGTLMAFLAYLAMFFGPLQFLTRVVDWMARSLAAAQRVFELLDTTPDVPEAAEPVAMDHIEGRVTFQNVTFGYDPYKPVLKNLTLDIKPGEMIGLVGRSGAGKSTTINLLCRFYDPNEGALLIDGVDARNIRQHDLRSQLGVVLQDTFLFSGTIAENITYGKRDATPLEIMRAAKAANAHHFIIQKPDGYDTIVGERGYQLSGGERQRIAIARAILHSPRILILDEATASVDTDTEREIQEAIARLTKGRTTIAIAHRLSTLRNADRLVVLKEGEIIEQGSHAELLAQEGEFHRLVNMQQEMAAIVGVHG